ncbi:hypothetical protein SAY86_009409 [Trapa natans]|uniref:Uncharacterized protein n=1 Tax=Trapa natans TaxID=22666 RepID=A0AAN7KYB3_TRANT|nr:hypothetical protein SAY86_009409 [Trapa natans]
MQCTDHHAEPERAGWGIRLSSRGKKSRCWINISILAPKMPRAGLSAARRAASLCFPSPSCSSSLSYRSALPLRLLGVGVLSPNFSLLINRTPHHFSFLSLNLSPVISAENHFPIQNLPPLSLPRGHHQEFPSTGLISSYSSAQRGYNSLLPLRFLDQKPAFCSPSSHRRKGTDMGFSKKPQLDGCLEPEGKRWVIAGIPSRVSLKPVSTKPRPKDGEEDEEEPRTRTPTSKGSRIPDKLPCPPAPMKRRPKCHFTGVREFFTPPDLESVFKLRADRTN